ncbi:MAG: murein transglycosylase A [Bilophila sp.]
MHGQHPRLTVVFFGSIATRFVPLLVLLALLTSCTATPKPDPDRATPPAVSHLWTPDMFVAVPPQDATRLAQALNPAQQHLKSWMDLSPALKANLAYVSRREAEQVAVAHGDIAITWGDIAHTLTRLQALLPRLDTEPELFATAFRWLRLAEGAEFSGYYEPVFKASRTRRPGYATPIYRVPPDLHQMDLGRFKTEYIGQRLVYRLENGVPVPYYTRAELDGTPVRPGKAARKAQVLRGKGLELAWLADPLDAYFLHVQGSGRLRFQDGSESAVRFAGSNGRPYLSIGKYLSGLGAIPSDSVSMQSIREWLTAHPAEQQELLFRNKRYIFFRMEPLTPASRGVGPIGSMGSPITPWVTLAVDRLTCPLGAVVAFEVNLATPGTPPRLLQGLGLAQDSGEAIKERRVDLFCGQGDQAALTAGHLNTPGEVWLLLAR